MKTIFTLLFSFLLIINIHSQMRGQGRMGGGHRQGKQQSEQQVSMEFNIEKMAGVIPYDEAKVLKKLKIKNDSKAGQITKFIRDYNKSVEEIKLKHHQTIKNTKLFLEQKRKEAKEQHDYTVMQEARERAMESLSPIRKEVKMQEQLLDTNMKNILNKKELKKWKRYKRKKHSSQGLKKFNNYQHMQGRGNGRGMHRGNAMF